MSKTRADHDGAYRVKEDGGSWVYYHGPFWTHSAAKGFITTRTRWARPDSSIVYTIEAIPGEWQPV